MDAKKLSNIKAKAIGVIVTTLWRGIDYLSAMILAIVLLVARTPIKVH